MNLDEQQKAAVSRWITDGLKLAEIQKRLEADFNLRLTYMEVRLLVDDLRLVPKDPEPVKQDLELKGGPGKTGGTPAPPPPSPASMLNPGQGEASSSRVSVTVDQVTRPGAIASGSVKFSDGQTSMWYLDQMGRLGMAPSQKGYRPPPADIEEFQIQVDQELAKLGL